MIKKSSFKKIVMVIALLCLFALAFISFVQSYPFARSPVLAKLNYPVITETTSGKLGDPINVLFIGDRSKIQNAFLKAGWKIPDPITVESSARIALDSLANRPYPTVPISNLYLYHRQQDMAFERPTNTVRVRDHIRLWDTQTTIDAQEVWCGSATHDNGIEISSTTDMPTHHIAPNVDLERNKVFQTLKPYMKNSVLTQFAQPNLYGKNGGGDWYYTDGDIAVLSTVSLDVYDVSPKRSAATAMKNWLFGLLSNVMD